ncbi:response regulator [Thiomicrorhabdus sediminis]|uniref:Response regulator n=1 Tax=Thiomicrorhabdus sediminis TaxID=2580412 RepID=A0A4P9K7Q7_9GAMM|nr:response regulator [Thiomicrorhabdus sediminis]
MTILVVDDFSTMRKIVRNQLQELGFDNILEADDGQSAWSLLDSGEKIDFIVSDWNMPGMTGIELLAKVRQDNRLHKIPFLLITAEAKRAQIMEATELGVDGYILKPFTASVLHEKMQRIFARQDP